MTAFLNPTSIKRPNAASVATIAPRGEPSHASDNDDLLSAFLEPCRFRCEPATSLRRVPPSGLDFERTGPAYLLMLEGSCRLELPDVPEEPLLHAHDFLVLT